MQNSVLSRLIWRVRIDGVDGFAGIERCAFRPAAHCVHYYITQGFRACCQAVAEKTLFLVFRSGFCVIPHSLLSHRPSTLICISKKKKKQKTFAGETHPKSHAVMLCHLWSCRKRCNQVRQVSCEVFASLLPAMIKWSIKPGERTPSPPSINAKMWPHFPLWSTFSCRREWLQACRSVRCDTSFPFRMKMSRLVSVEEKAQAQSPCSNIQNHI